VRELDVILAERGQPAVCVPDNGTELTGMAVTPHKTLFTSLAQVRAELACWKHDTSPHSGPGNLTPTDTPIAALPDHRNGVGRGSAPRPVAPPSPFAQTGTRPTTMQHLLQHSFDL
jgi:putative transposase